MLVTIHDFVANAYAESDRRSAVVAELAEGDEVDLTRHLTRRGEQWVAVVLPDGQRGFLLGTTHIKQYHTIAPRGMPPRHVEYARHAASVALDREPDSQ